MGCMLHLLRAQTPRRFAVGRWTSVIGHWCREVVGRVRIMDERAQPGGDPPGGSGTPTAAEDDLDTLDRAAQADEVAAAIRDHNATISDQDAATRDRAAELRDAKAESRDQETPSGQDIVPTLYADRRRARSDRHDAALDREGAADDRDGARADRHAAQVHRERAGHDRAVAREAVDQMRQLVNRAEDDTETMIAIGQAQGIIMATRDVTPLEALLQLSLRAAEDRSELAAAAQTIVRQERAAPGEP